MAWILLGLVVIFIGILAHRAWGDTAEMGEQPQYDRRQDMPNEM